MPYKFYKSRSKLKRAPIYYLLIILAAGFPLLLVVAASFFAEKHGCILNEAGAHPCIIGSTDYGELFSMMFVFGWLMLVSLPGGFFALIWLTYVTVYDFRFYSGKHKTDYDRWLEQNESKG